MPSSRTRFKRAIRIDDAKLDAWLHIAIADRALEIAGIPFPDDPIALVRLAAMTISYVKVIREVVDGTVSTTDKSDEEVARVARLTNDGPRWNFS